MPRGIHIQALSVKSSELRRTTDAVRARVLKDVAEATIERVQKRTDHHPAAMALRADGLNQNASQIRGPRGGPGIIRPVRAKALAFVWQGEQWFRKSVNSKGLGPLIEAEAKRVRSEDIRTRNFKV